jgi:hypothetical protein
MLDKFDYYDLLGIVIPGVLLTYWLPICYPHAVTMAAAAGFPASIDFVGFAAVAFFVGQLTQALASFLEPVLYWTFGGRPSDQALQAGLGERYVPADAGTRIRAQLAEVAGRDATDRALFLEAMRRANAAGNPRVERFNALFAYHRALMVVVAAALILLATSTQWGAATKWSSARIAAWLVALSLILLLLWFRTKQRAFYYAREVLITAKGTLAVSGASSPSATQESRE